MFNRLILIAILANTPLGATMKLISPAFSHNQEIPAQYTCDGQNISPALAWSDVPETTNSFALIVDDPDAPAKVWVHWVVFNIPSTINHFNQNTASAGQKSLFYKEQTILRLKNGVALARQVEPITIASPSMHLITYSICLPAQLKNSF